MPNEKAHEGPKSSHRCFGFWGNQVVRIWVAIPVRRRDYSWYRTDRKTLGSGTRGLFLAFPAIFPASATLVEKKEKEKKAKAGIDGTNRGRTLAGIDAAGAALGSIGLVAFALTVWIFLGDVPVWLVLLGAIFAWALVGGVLWYLRKTKYGLRLFQTRNREHPKLSSR